MFDKVKIQRLSDRMISLSFDGVSIIITCRKDDVMISTNDFEFAGVTGQPDQVIGKNGVWLRNK